MILHIKNSEPVSGHYLGGSRYEQRPARQSKDQLGERQKELVPLKTKLTWQSQYNVNEQRASERRIMIPCRETKQSRALELEREKVYCMMRPTTLGQLSVTHMV